MRPQFFASARFWQHLSKGLLALTAPVLLASCNNNDIDLDALNAQALQRMKEVYRVDSTAIAKYIADSSFTNVQRQPSGLCIVTKAPGTGDLPVSGQQVSVLYKGKFFSNAIFDQSKPGPDGRTLVPITFPIGQQRVIAGWDEGIGLMRKGQKAILLIPSRLAYGSAGAGSVIPPDTPLRFDVELTNIQ